MRVDNGDVERVQFLYPDAGVELVQHGLDRLRAGDADRHRELVGARNALVFCRGRFPGYDHSPDFSAFHALASVCD